ncbi:hypothetical protein ACFWP5_33115 [Streptomyces sp. NPDC058469]|uniref:hypothetical protein n=1 Tax=Streptomyces sp. NPDC058469 TaxID=3346514 RepID=UPI003654BFA7
MDHLDEGGRGGDHPQVVGEGEPAGDGAVAQDGLGEALAVEDEGAAWDGGGAGHAASAPPCVCSVCCTALTRPPRGPYSAGFGQ